MRLSFCCLFVYLFHCVMFNVKNMPETVEAAWRPLTVWQFLLLTSFSSGSLSKSTLTEQCSSVAWMEIACTRQHLKVQSPSPQGPKSTWMLCFHHCWLMLLTNKLLWLMPIRTHPWMQGLFVFFNCYYNSSSSSACDFGPFLCDFLRFAWKRSRSAGPENFPSAFLYLALQEEKATLTAQWLTINASVTHCELATLGTGQWGVV